MLSFYDHYNNYNGSFIPYNNKNVSGEILKRQVNLMNNEIIKNKLREKLVFSIKQNMNSYLIYKNQSLIKPHKQEDLMLLEASLWKSFYRKLNNLILNNNYKFDNRNKQPPLDPFNCLLSFLNMMLYNEFLKQMTKTPLNTTISFHHSFGTNRHSLILDLSENFKIIFIIPLILRIINKNEIDIEKDFNFFKNACYLNENGISKIGKIWEKELNKIFYFKGNYKLKTLIYKECLKFLKFLIEEGEIDFIYKKWKQ